MGGAPRAGSGGAAQRNQGPPAAASGGRRELRGGRLRPEPGYGGGAPGADASGLPLAGGWNALFLLDFAPSGIFRPYRRRGRGFREAWDVQATQIRQKDGIFYFASYRAKDLLARVRFISRFYGQGEEIAPSRIAQDD